MHSSSFLQPVGCEAGPSVASSWTLCSTRRALESLIAAVALVVSIPLMFVIALAVRLSSGKPILFRQRRMGRNGIEFTLYKFRSMKVKSNDTGPLITVRGDRRITAVGSFLRRYKLDELPQLWNVLRGDMSIVGARPKLAHHEGLFLAARPGITGAATLAFRNEEALLAALPTDQMDKVYQTHFKAAKARLDAAYMREATFLSDCLIVWATIAACLFPGNTANLFSEEPFRSPLPAKATHWKAHIARAASASQESFESRKTPPSKGNVAWQTSLILFCLILTPVHICAQETPKATVSSGPDSRFDAFADYSYWGAVGSVDSQSLRGSDLGINVNLSWYLMQHIGLQTDDKYFFSETDEWLTSVSAGPIFRFPRFQGFIPLVHILGGAADLNGQGKGPQLTVGEGLDYEFPWPHHRFAVRIAQVDYMHGHIDSPTGAIIINSETFSSGMMMYFGGTRQPALKLHFRAHPQLLHAGETVKVSSTPSGLDSRRPAIYHWASPNLALAASTPGVNVDKAGLQSETYAVIVQVSQGPTAGQSTTCTTKFDFQDAGARS